MYKVKLSGCEENFCEAYLHFFLYIPLLIDQYLSCN